MGIQKMKLFLFLAASALAQDVDVCKTATMAVKALHHALTTVTEDSKTNSDGVVMMKSAKNALRNTMNTAWTTVKTTPHQIVKIIVIINTNKKPVTVRTTIKHVTIVPIIISKTA